MLIQGKTTSFKLSIAALLMFWTTAVWAKTVEYDGLIQPYEVVEIGAPTEGIIAKVTVDRCSPVKQGEILVELESSVERVALEKAKAMATFDGEIGLQQTRLAFAKRVHERVKQLSAISTHDKDQAATEIIMTKYQLKKAREKNTLAKLELKKAQSLLARHTIRSPISGVVVERYVSPGEYVDNQPLLRVAQTDPLRVEVIVPAQMFGTIRPGMTATIVPDLPIYGEQTATVSLVDKIIDSASNTIGVRLELSNTEQQLPAGLRCLVRFKIDAPPAEIKQQTDRIVLDHQQD
jgi:RND family efflux transporter MFP subunit